jgi:arylsulfatase A-like enzyme
MTHAWITRTTFSRRRLLRGAAAAAVAGSAGVVVPPAARAVVPSVRRPPTRRPNVVVISFDDLAWNDFGCYGNDFHETPHIDLLASRGMRFTQAYAAAPVCSPTRAALMTGLFPARTGITNYLRPESAPSNLYLAPEFQTVPEYIGDRGYRSALIGKWHLTEDYSGPYRRRSGNPYSHGFDDVLLSEEKYIGSGDMFFPYRFMPSVTSGEAGEYLTDRIGDDSANWITWHAARPFFLHVSNYAIHHEWQAPERLIRKYRRKKRLNPQFQSDRYRPVVAAMVERCDYQVGRIVHALEDAGVADNTLILITSDNGGAIRPSNRPLRGRKGSLYEGGIRVPLIACWPGTVTAGTTSDAVVSTIDILPTIKDLAGAGDWADLDGVSLAGVLTRQESLARETYWYYPHYLLEGVPSAAVRSGRYKLIKRLRTGEIELYDLIDDPRERENLAMHEPLVADVLHRRLRRHIRQMRRVPAPPTPREFPVRVTRVDPARRETDHEMLLLAGSAKTDLVEDRLVISSRRSAEVLLQSRRAPTNDNFALILDRGLFGQGRKPSHGTLPGDRLQVGVGLAKDAENYLRATYDHDRRTVGWTLFTGGVDRTGDGEPEQLNALEGTVDLSGDGAGLGMSVTGSTVGVYADQGKGWEFLFLLDIGGSVALTDPEVRREWRYATGVGLAADSDALGDDEIRQH